MRKSTVVKAVQFNDSTKVGLMVNHSEHRVEVEVPQPVAPSNLGNLCLTDPDLRSEFRGIINACKRFEEGLYITETSSPDGSITITMYRQVIRPKHDWALFISKDLGMDEKVFSINIIDGKIRYIPDMTTYQLWLLIKHIAQDDFISILCEMIDLSKPVRACHYVTTNIKRY